MKRLILEIGGENFVNIMNELNEINKSDIFLAIDKQIGNGKIIDGFTSNIHYTFFDEARMEVK